MTPERAAVLLAAIAASIEAWTIEIREIEKCCPAKVVHLRSAMEQAHWSLLAILEADGKGLE